jgi:hypothetical protein
MQNIAGTKIRILTVVLLAIILFPSLSVARDSKVQIDSIKAVFSGYPVNPFGRTLFNVKARIGPYSAENRAKTITELIWALATDPCSRKALTIQVWRSCRRITVPCVKGIKLPFPTTISPKNIHSRHLE